MRIAEHDSTFACVMSYLDIIEEVRREPEPEDFRRVSLLQYSLVTDHVEAPSRIVQNIHNVAIAVNVNNRLCLSTPTARTSFANEPAAEAEHGHRGDELHICW